MQYWYQNKVYCTQKVQKGILVQKVGTKAGTVKRVETLAILKSPKTKKGSGSLTKSIYGPLIL